MERLIMTNLPTPIHFFDVYESNNIYIKRDDMTDLALGGNKARKLEYFMADALMKKHDCIVTYGGHQSNHCRMTAAAASKNGLKTVLVLSKPENINRNGNYLLYSLFGAEVVWTETDRVGQTIESTVNDLESKGYRPYFIEGGGHGNPGTHAYKEAYEEILKQQIDMGTEFDYMFLASGTGTTQAGLEVGNMLHGSKSVIAGISIARGETRGRQVIFDSIKEYCSFQGLPLNLRLEDVYFDDSYIGGGYADVYPEVAGTIKYVAQKAGILLDPVYTGKAFYGMLDTIKKKGIHDSDILFIHTGGVPLIFSHVEAFNESGSLSVEG